MQGLLLRSERGERDLSDFSLRNPGLGLFVIDRIRVFSARPRVVINRCDRCFDLLVHAHRDRHMSPGIPGGFGHF